MDVLRTPALLAVLLGGPVACGYDVVNTIELRSEPPGLVKPSVRDKLLWPFAAESIWNMPLGSGAQYLPAALGSPSTVGVEDTYFIVTSSSDPLRELRLPGPRPDTPCAGATVVDTLPVPNSFVLSAEANSSYANATSLLLPDGQTLRELIDVARCDAGGPIFAFPSVTEDIYGLGLRGAQGGSGMSAVGGSFRVGELTGSGSIRHAVKVAIWAEPHLYVDPADPTSCFQWPADRCDQNASDPVTGYKGTIPQIRQGTLLALPPELTAEQLGLETFPGALLFSALQDYGAYITGSSGSDSVLLGFESSAVADFEHTFGYGPRSGPTGNDAWAEDVRRMVVALQLVANNGPDTVGGGGTPRRDLAPPFAN